MSEDGKQELSERKKRVQRLKYLIIYLLIVLIMVPIVCCVALMVQVRELNRKIDRLVERVTLLEQVGRAEASKQSETPVMSRDTVVHTREGEWTELFEPDVSEDHLHKVYLTFDDGPSIYTDEILDILEEYDIKGTFFVVGKEDERSQNALRRIVEEGHTLGMHSYSHKYSQLYASLDSFEADFEKQRAYLEDVTGETCRFYRFPGGSSNTVSTEDMHTFIDFLDSQDVVYFDWNISSGDGGRPLLDVDTLVRNSTEDVPYWHTAVVLMHDSADKRTTVDALPRIIESLLAMEDTVILPITEETVPVQHIH